MKGLNGKYRPSVGERCLISGPGCDDDDGYVFGEFEILWKSNVFVLYGNPNCWPNLEKWDHIIAKPIHHETNNNTSNMRECLTIEKEQLLSVLWGICLADHLGDVMGSIAPLTRLFGLEDEVGQDDMLETMKDMDLIPEYQRD